MAIAGMLGTPLPGTEAILAAALRHMEPAAGASDRLAVHDSVALAAGNMAQLSSAGELVAAFEGGLFEREELLRRLGYSAAETPLSDAALVLSAYRRWGETFPGELDGEFAFAVLDRAKHTCLLGRDAMGRGAMHYCWQGQRLLFATEPVGLQAWPEVRILPDDDQIVAAMTLRFQAGRTFFKGVRYPPPGHVVATRAGGLERVVRYWFPDEQRQLKLSAGGYAEALRDAMVRSVEVRLPAEGLVASELSAGYDSAAVTAIAAAALARRNRPLLAITSVPTYDVDATSVLKHAFANEWPLASHVARMHSNIEHLAVTTGAAPWMDSIDTMTAICGGPPLFIRNLPWMYAVRRTAQQRGVTMVLNGQNGNLAGSYDGTFTLFDMLRRGRWGHLARTAMTWHRLGASWPSLAMRAWMPTSTTRSRLRRLRGSGSERFTTHSLLRPEFIRATGSSVPDYSVVGPPVEGSRRNGAARRLSIMQIVDFGAQYAAEHRILGVHRSDPTADRRLVELCLAIPDEAFCPGGMRRELYRQAMRDILPPELLHETGLGLQASDFLENFAAALPFWRDEVAAYRTSDLVGRYLDLERMQEMLESFPARYAADRAQADLLYNYTFGGAVTLGRFLRRIEHGIM